jgi:hypothetical protein
LKELKWILLAGYVGIGLVVGFFSHFFGRYQHEKMGVNLVMGAINWPGILIPPIQQVVPGIILLSAIGYIMARRS